MYCRAMCHRGNLCHRAMCYRAMFHRGNLCCRAMCHIAMCHRAMYHNKSTISEVSGCNIYNSYKLNETINVAVIALQCERKTYYLNIGSF